jgi:ribosome-binding factor A
MGRRSHGRRAGPSQRQLRVGESLRHQLADLLLRHHLRDPTLAAAEVTVAEVRVSTDLRHARVFVTELGGGLRPELAAALARAAPLWRGELARRLRLRIAPELVFQADPTFAEATRIERLLTAERAALADHVGVDQPAVDAAGAAHAGDPDGEG